MVRSNPRCRAVSAGVALCAALVGLTFASGAAAQESKAVRATASLSIPVLQQVTAVAAETLADGTRRYTLAVSSNHGWDLVLESSSEASFEWRLAGAGSFHAERDGEAHALAGGVVNRQSVVVEVRGGADVAFVMRPAQPVGAGMRTVVAN